MAAWLSFRLRIRRALGYPLIFSGAILGLKIGLDTGSEIPLILQLTMGGSLVTLGPALVYVGRRARVLLASDLMIIDRRRPVQYRRPFVLDDWILGGGGDEYPSVFSGGYFSSDFSEPSA